MSLLHTVLLIAAFLLLLLAAVGVSPAPPSRINLLAAGLALWVLSLLLP